MENKDNEIKFRMAEQMLMRMLKNGLITDEEYRQISQLNRETFMPRLHLYTRDFSRIVSKKVLDV